MGFEFIRVINWNNKDYVEFESMDFRKQQFIRNYNGLDKTKFFMKHCPCGTDTELIEREYFNRLENIYNGYPELNGVT